MPRHFDFLRIIPWEPKFEWVSSIEEAADLINKPHEDYPKRVKATAEEIHYWSRLGGIFAPTPETGVTNNFLSQIHGVVFRDQSFSGKFREVDVRVGNHHPPEHEKIIKLMEELRYCYPNIKTIERLIEWAYDFLTIHPFQDGNGRVSGIVMAIISHQLNPESGWLAPITVKIT